MPPSPILPSKVYLPAMVSPGCGIARTTSRGREIVRAAPPRSSSATAARVMADGRYGQPPRRIRGTRAESTARARHAPFSRAHRCDEGGGLDATGLRIELRDEGTAG